MGHSTQYQNAFVVHARHMAEIKMKLGEFGSVFFSYSFLHSSSCWLTVAVNMTHITIIFFCQLFFCFFFRFCCIRRGLNCRVQYYEYTSIYTYEFAEFEWTWRISKRRSTVLYSHRFDIILINKKIKLHNIRCYCVSWMWMEWRNFSLHTYLWSHVHENCPQIEYITDHKFVRHIRNEIATFLLFSIQRRRKNVQVIRIRVDPIWK